MFLLACFVSNYLIVKQVMSNNIERICHIMHVSIEDPIMSYHFEQMTKI